MKLHTLLLFSVLVVTIKARHKKDWQRVNLKKAGRELQLSYYSFETIPCLRGAGFYRDPKDCHQYIRCVDEFSSGRRFSAFVGRCEPGLVFDEKISSCNWPELAAPCSDAPEKFIESPSKFKPQEDEQNNIISQENEKWDKSNPDQQEVYQTEDYQQSIHQEQQQIPQVIDQQLEQQQQPNTQQVESFPINDSQQQVHEAQDEIINNFQEAVQVPVTQETVALQTAAEEEPKGKISPGQRIKGKPQQTQENTPSQIEQKKEIFQEIQIVHEPENQHSQIQEENKKPQAVVPDYPQEQDTSSNFQEILEDGNSEVLTSQDESKVQQTQEQSEEWFVPQHDEIQHSEPIQIDQEESIVQIPTSLEEPIICYSEGFFRHPTNCSRFVRCVKEQDAYAVHFFECGEKLVFDEKNSYCTRSSQDNCNSRRIKRQVDNEPLECQGEGFFRHPVDCKAFYRCVLGASGSYETHLFSCPETLVFDEEYTTCNWPDKAPPCQTRRWSGYQPRRTEPPPKSVYKPVWKTSPTKSWSTSKPRNDFIDKNPLRPAQDQYNQKSTKAPPRGEQLCSTPGFYRHNKDCTKFYKCVQRQNTFIRYELSCPNNLAFDASTTRCVPQKFVNQCNNKKKRPLPPRQDDEGTVTETTSTTKSSATSGDNSEEEIQCQEAGYFRNPSDCNRFYRCVDFSGEKQEFVRYDFKCPDGLVFDESNDVCSWPDQSAPCEGGSDTEEDSGSSGSTPKDSGESSTTSSSRSSTTTKPTKRTTTTRTTSRPTKRTTTQKSTQAPESMTTDASTPEDEENDENSETDNDKSRPGEGSSQDGCEKEGFFRNPEDCNKFFRCVDFSGDGGEFVRYDFSCPEELVFDEENSVCNWPDDSAPCDAKSGGNDKDGDDETSNSKKEQESTTKSSITTTTKGKSTPASRTERPKSSSTTKSPGKTTSSRTEKPKPARTTSSPGVKTTKPSTKNPNKSEDDGSETESKGECKETGFFRDPEDCNKFYRCVDHNGDNSEFVKYEFSCPDGLVFDEENSVCNWPDQSAPCDGSSGKESSTNSDDVTSEFESTTQRTTTHKSTTQRSTTRKSTTPRSTTPRTTTQRSTTRKSSTRRPSTTTKKPSGTTEISTTVKSSSDQTTSEEVTSSTSKPTRTTSIDENNTGTTGKTSEGEGGASNGECTEAGFFRNPEDCNKFYRCVDFNGDGQEFVKYDFTCPEGLYFDETNSVCNWPDQSPPCEASGESSTKKDETSSSKTESTMTDSSTTQSTKRTTSKPRQTTTSRTTSKPQRTTTSRTTSKPQRTTTSRTTSKPQRTTTSQTTSRAQQTTSKPRQTTTRPQQTTSKPRQTTSRPRQTTSRPEQTTSRPRQTTSRPEQTTSRPRQTTSRPQTTARPKLTTQSTTTLEQSTTSSSDKEECTESGFFRCRDDCSRFHRCVEDESGQLRRYDFKCPEGLIFDDTTKKCEWPSSDSNCELTSTESTEQTITTIGSSTTKQKSTKTTTTAESTTTSTTSSTMQSNECSEEGFFRNPDDCSKYYRCMDEGDGRLTREDFSCAEDEVFDEEMRFCNRKDLAPPCDETSSETKSTTESSSSTTSSGITTDSSMSTTAKISTTESSSTTSQESTNSVTPTTSSSSECTESGFRRDSEDCAKFYRCIEENGDYLRYNFTCPEGLIFDINNERCDSPSSELVCDVESTTSSESATTASSTSKSSGECTEEGFFRDPNDCSKYYRCLDEGDGTITKEEFSCADDEVFDEEMRYCNSKDLAPPCNETSTSSESTQESTSSDSSSSTESTDGSTSSESSSIETSTPEIGESTQTTSSEAGPSGDGNCDEEGFHRDPNDCRKFYRCVDFRGDGQFTKYDFECPDDLVFDDKNNVCNWPSSVRSCESSNKSNQSTTESASTTSGTEGTTGTTQSGSTSLTTDNDKTTSQADKTTSTTQSEPSSSTDSSTGGNEVTQSTTESSPGTSTGSTQGDTASTAGETSQTTKKKSSSDIECKEEGYFRNPDDCNKFYRCVDFAGTGESYVRYDFECPEGLIFDEVNTVCNWPEQSPGCESGSSGKNDSTDTTTEIPNTKSTEDSSSTRDDTTKTTVSESSSTESTTSASQGSTTRSSSETETMQTSISSTSSSEEFSCEEEGFFRDDKDCKKYYECKRDEDTGELVKIDCECPEGHVFDMDGWYCNAEELAPPCDDGSFKCTQEGFFRDPEDCTRYHHCNKTAQGSDQYIKESFQCPDGYVFDEEGRYCNVPELTEPCDNSTTTKSGESSSKTTTSSSEGSSTGSTAITASGTATTSSGTITTASESATTSSGTKTTVSESGTSSSSEGSGDCTEEGYFRDPEDCSKYYSCIRDEETGNLNRKDFECSDGRIFDEGASYCNEPELTEEPCTTGNSTDQTNGDDSTTQSSSDSTTQKTSSSTGSSVNRRGGGDPQCTEAGFFRHPRDCNKFYRCVDFAGTGESFVRFDFDCPEGLHFDEVNSVCNWPTMTPSCESDSESRL